MIRLKSAVIGGILALSTACWTTNSVNAADIYRVDEVWEMAVHQPNPITTSPQVTFFTASGSDPDANYFQLQMNYAADADFSGGGFHVAAVKNGNIVDQARSHTKRPLTSSNNLIRWTNVMAVIDGELLFAVKDGSCQDWGDFGGPEYLVRVAPSPVPNLADYHPDQSLDAVDIGFGANRIDSITLVEVHVYYSDGTEQTIEVNRQP